MKTIVWDVDDVLNDLMREWFEKHYLPRHPGCPLTYGEISENPPHKLLNITLDAYRASLDEFRLASGHDLTPVPGTLRWFRQHGNEYHHMALTAVPLTFAGISSEWVFRHFGAWIRSFNLVPTPRKNDPTPSFHRSKGEFLAWLGTGDILVDDSLQNLGEAKQAGLDAVCFPRPWNGSKLPADEALQRITPA